MKNKCIWCILFLCLTCGGHIIAQQRAVADLHYDDTTRLITLVYDSYISNGDVYNRTTPAGRGVEGAIWLNRLQANEDGYAEFTIDHVTSNGANVNLTISLTNEDDTTEIYGLRLDNGQVYAGTSSTAIDTYTDQDLFRIERCQDKILYYKGSTKYTLEDSVLPSIRLVAHAAIVTATPGSTGTLPRLVMTFPHNLTTLNFIALRKQLDGSYIQSNRQKLKFTYVEQYARDAGATINCRIYDWQRQLRHNVNLPNVYGVNWQVLTLPSNLTLDEYYVLEVGGANKGERYYLRFKY